MREKVWAKRKSRRNLGRGIPKRAKGGEKSINKTGNIMKIPGKEHGEEWGKEKVQRGG